VNDYKDGFDDGYAFAKDELVERLSDLEGLDDWTIEQICDLIERNKL
jgi:hypothetical protein